MHWQRVVEPKAVRLLFDPSSRELLKPFMLEARSVTSVAVQAGLPINAVHHRVRQMHTLGLLEVARLEPRAGRSIKHYQSTAQGFFVPFVATASEGLSGFVRMQMQPYFEAFMDLLARSGSSLVKDIKEAGMRMFNAGGYIHIDLSPRGQGFDFQEFLHPDAPALMSSFVELKLSHSDAKKLQLEMLELLERYGNLSGTEHSGTAHHVVHLGLVPGQMPLE
jgi:hypothetical protein